MLMAGGGGGQGEVNWGGGVLERRFGGGLGGGGYMPPKAKCFLIAGSRTSPCPPFNHIITVNLTQTFAASWFGHASHFG